MKRPIVISSLWIWHSLFCLCALLACVPILWPQVFLPDAWEQTGVAYAGLLVLCSMAASLLLLCSTAFLMLLRLRNLRTLGHLVAWAGLWGVGGCLFVLLAWVANVPLPGDDQHPHGPIQRTDNLYMADVTLSGPTSLQIDIAPENYPTDTIAPAPHLQQLEHEQAELLRVYIDASPRWASYTDDDNFFSKPGHVVMVPPITGGIPGVVHAAFRRLSEGEPMPTGYRVVRPGDPMPPTPEGSEQVADLAVDLGGSYYLLLAWRGTSHADTAHRALNAALATVDSMVQELAADPSYDTLQRVLTGQQRLDSGEPRILLCQPAAQYGTYQAEIVVNPHEAGTLMLRLVDLETNTTLRLFSCQAMYSDNPKELFRHDIPGSMPEQMRASSFGHVPGLLPEKAPLFIVRPGEGHQFFGIAAEVVFSPASPSKTSRVLLRRCYRVQAYEVLALPRPAQQSPDSPQPPAATPPTAEPESPAAPEPAPTTAEPPATPVSQPTDAATPDAPEPPAPTAEPAPPATPAAEEPPATPAEPTRPAAPAPSPEQLAPPTPQLAPSLAIQGINLNPPLTLNPLQNTL